MEVGEELEEEEEEDDDEPMRVHCDVNEGCGEYVTIFSA